MQADEKRRQYLKIANMRLLDIAQNHIANACGISESRISQILDTPEYKEIEQGIIAQKVEEQSLLNKGWDGVEKLAILKVVNHLQDNPEPDFALRAAALANKAVRRGGHTNNGINIPAEGRNVIVLNTQFVSKMENNKFVVQNKNEIETDRSKKVDYLTAKATQDLLQINPENKNQVTLETGDINQLEQLLRDK